MPSPIPAIYKSVMRSVADTIVAVNATKLYPTPVEFHNWEERTPETQLPATTLIGLDGFGFDENEGRWLIRFSLAVSSFKDANLLKEIDLLGLLHERYGEGKKIDLLRLSDGALGSELVVSAFQVAPMAQSEMRNYRNFNIELLRTGI